MKWISQLPGELRQRAYASETGGELAWGRDDALAVIEWLRRQNAAALGVDVWLPTEAGPTIPMPFVYTLEVPREPSEPWDAFVRRAADRARSYVESFRWDARDPHPSSVEPYFNIEVQPSEAE